MLMMTVFSGIKIQQCKWFIRFLCIALKIFLSL